MSPRLSCRSRTRYVCVASSVACCSSAATSAGLGALAAPRQVASVIPQQAARNNEALLDFRTLCRRGLLAPVLPNDGALVGIEGAAAGAPEGLRDGGNGVARRRLRDGEIVSAGGTGRQIPRDQARRLRSFRRARRGGRAKLAEGGGVLAKLRLILHLGLIDGAHFGHGGHFLAVHARLAHLRAGDGENHQDDRDDDQQLNEREAALVSPAFRYTKQHTIHIIRRE